jgi:hypothetical protein
VQLHCVRVEELGFGIAELRLKERPRIYTDNNEGFNLKKLKGRTWNVADRFHMVLRCAGHLDHHVGQMIYLCAELKRRSA